MIRTCGLSAVGRTLQNAVTGQITLGNNLQPTHLEIECLRDNEALPHQLWTGPG